MDLIQGEHVVSVEQPLTALDSEQPVKPFIKWAGGKRRIMPRLSQFFPESYVRYHEPMLGGGAVFFHLKPFSARLSDTCENLTNLWLAVKDEPERLLKEIDKLTQNSGETWYYECRDRFNSEGLHAIERAALMLYLNKTCFNGLYRENSSGKFNSPYGKRKSPEIANPKHILAASTRLQGAIIEHADYKSVLDHASAGDFIYFDPPYVPISRTAAFTAYSKGGFGLEDQEELARVFEELSDRGCQVMLSNSNSEIVKELYEGFRIEEISAPRSISGKTSSRGNVGELVVLSY